MSKNNNFSLGKFQGKVLESLKNIEDKLDENNTQHTIFFQRTSKNREDIVKLKHTPSLSREPIKWILSIFGLNKG